MLRDEMDKVDPKMAYTFVGAQYPNSSFANPAPLQGRFCSSGGAESFVAGRQSFTSGIGVIQFVMILTRKD
jgi:hypothetical protein